MPDAMPARSAGTAVMATVVIGVRHNATPLPHKPSPTRTRAELRCSLKMSMSRPSINMHSPARMGTRAPIRPTRCPTSGDTMATAALNGRIIRPVTLGV
ncbi:Uncharacterised protein [Mycobacterium tuberculosis]|nr:Uncharacterised protein [Mycobacterium tuberculosis]